MEYSAGSLAEHLIDQLHGVSGDIGNLARIIAQTLDETGYLTVPLEQIAELSGVPVALVERALRLVQDLDPAGVGARSLSECLALQAKVGRPLRSGDGATDRQSRSTFEGKTSDLKRICSVDDEDLADMIRELRAFDPKPGCRVSRRIRNRGRTRRIHSADRSGARLQSSSNSGDPSAPPS